MKRNLYTVEFKKTVLAFAEEMLKPCCTAALWDQQKSGSEKTKEATVHSMEDND
jgi:hypothetical protein